MQKSNIFVPDDTLIVFTDGGARGNPGPAAVGVVIKDSSGRTIAGFGKSIGTATNNEAEYMAVIFALQKIRSLKGKERCKFLTVHVSMDSELAVRQLNGIYKIEQEHLQTLFMRIWNLKIDFSRVTFTHVPRGRNKEADKFVNEALDKEQGMLL